MIGKIDLIEYARFKIKAGQQGLPTAYLPSRIVKPPSNSLHTRLLADDGHVLDIDESRLEKLYTMTDGHQIHQAVEGAVLLFTTVKSGSTGGDVMLNDSCVQMTCRSGGGVYFVKFVKLDNNGKVMRFPNCTIEINGRTVIRYSEDVCEMNFNRKVIYEGSIDANGTLKGKGKLRIEIGTDDEKSIKGEWFGDGKSVRNATIEYLKQGITYIGDLKDMMRHGKGRLINHAAGSIFDFTFVDDTISGPFSGILEDGKAEDIVYGNTMTGKRYVKAETIMPAEEMASFGNLEWGLIHEGDLNPLTMALHGHGKLTYPNGDYIIGDNDGYSTLYTKSAGTLSGNMKCSTFIGNVRYEMSDGSVYEGELENYRPHSQGAMTSSDGLVHQGTWVDGRLVQTFDQIAYMADEKNRASKSTAGKPDTRSNSGGEVQSGGARSFKPPTNNEMIKMRGFEAFKLEIYTGRHTMSISASMPRSYLPMLSTRRPTFAGLMISVMRMYHK